MKKTILFVVLLCNLISFGQDKLKFKDISRHGLYVMVEGEYYVPDYDAEYIVPMYDGKYNKSLEDFIKQYEKINKELEATESLEKKEKRKKKKQLKMEKQLLMESFYPVYFNLKSNRNTYPRHYQGIEFLSPLFLEATKKELVRLKGKTIDINHISQASLSRDVPKKKIKLKTLAYLDDHSKVQGEYILEGEIKVSTENCIKYRQYNGEVLEKGVESCKYEIYNFFKSVDGSGVDFYNGSIDVYNEYMVTREAIPLTAKEKNIINKMNIYKKEMIVLIDKMALFRSNPSAALDATKKGKVLQRKVNALYGNNDDNYYEFAQLLDMNTKEVMNEFNQVLRGSVILFNI